MAVQLLKNFNFTVPDVFFGNGAIHNIAELIENHQPGCICIFTDKGVVQAGLVDQVKEVLAGPEVIVFDDVEAEPSVSNVMFAANKIAAYNPDMLIGLGGGSAIDVSKIVSILLKFGGEIRSYMGIGNIPGRGIPTVMIPTTAGTGSEVSKYAILNDKEAGTKLGAVSRYLVPDYAIIDPGMTLTMPRSITAATGCDAFIHAVEGYLATNSTPITDLLALEAIRLIFDNLPIAFARGDSIQARYNMAYGSFLAGVVLNHAGGSSSHALGYPIASEHHMPHGVACMLTFIEVLEYFAPCSHEKFSQMAQAIGIPTEMSSAMEISRSVISEIRNMAEYLEMSFKLSDFDVERSKYESYAKSVVANQQRLLTNGPRQLNEKDIIKIYEACA